MRPIRLCLASLALTLLSSCDDPEEKKTEIWDLHAEPWVCDNGVDNQLCRTYTIVDTQETEGLYDSIGGFDPQWGHSYRIEVEIIPIEFAYDGGTLAYELIEVIDEQPNPGFEFDATLQFGFSSVDVEQNTGEVGPALPFTCAPEQCTELATVLDENHSVRAQFRFGPAEQLLPLELVSIEVSEGG